MGEQRQDTINHGISKNQELRHDAPAHSDYAERVCSGIQYTIRFLIIVVCLTLLGIVLNELYSTFAKKRFIQGHNRTTSIEGVRFQVTICPVSPFEEIRSLEYGTYTKWAKKLDWENQIFDYFNITFGRKVMKCLYDSQFVHDLDPFEDKMRKLKVYRQCLVPRELFTTELAEDLLEIYIWSEHFIAMNYLELFEERTVDYYENIYKDIDMLHYDDGSDLKQYLDGVSRNMKDYIITDFHEDLDINFLSPSQKIEFEYLNTRFGPKCHTYTLSEPSEKRELFQRYEVTMSFISARHVYMLVFLTELHEYSDIPGATLLLPYRTTMAANSILYVVHSDRVKTDSRLHTCADYDKKSSEAFKQSRVLCIEHCLMKSSIEEKNATCMTPWMLRSTTEDIFEKHKKHYCKSSDEIMQLRSALEDVFEGSSTECFDSCPKKCDQLNSVVKVMGFAASRTHESNQTHTLTIYVSNILDEFINILAYDEGTFKSELMGYVSFILGIAVVAGMDWVFTMLLWIFGKLPYIPAMPPLINVDIYPRDVYDYLRWEFLGEPIPGEGQTRKHRRHHSGKSGEDDAISVSFPVPQRRQSSIGMLADTVAAVVTSRGSLGHVDDQLGRRHGTNSRQKINANAKNTIPNNAGGSPMIKISIPQEALDTGQVAHHSRETTPTGQQQPRVAERSPAAAKQTTAAARQPVPAKRQSQTGGRQKTPDAYQSNLGSGRTSSIVRRSPSALARANQSRMVVRSETNSRATPAARKPR